MPKIAKKPYGPHWEHSLFWSFRNYGRAVGARSKADREAWNTSNPLSSVKDRIGYAMIAAAEEEGKNIQGNTVLIDLPAEYGIALALLRRISGYSLIISCRRRSAVERRNLLSALGAELVLTPGADGMKGAIFKCRRAFGARYRTPMCRNSSRTPQIPNTNRKTTAVEILNDTGGDIDIFVSGVGTGGHHNGRRRSAEEE
jgi:cysteine synthase A